MDEDSAVRRTGIRRVMWRRRNQAPSRKIIPKQKYPGIIRVSIKGALKWALISTSDSSNPSAGKSIARLAEKKRPEQRKIEARGEKLAQSPGAPAKMKSRR